MAGSVVPFFSRFTRSIVWLHFFQIAIEDNFQRAVMIQAGEIGDVIKLFNLALSQARVDKAVFLFIDAINRYNLVPGFA